MNIKNTTNVDNTELKETLKLINSSQNKISQIERRIKQLEVEAHNLIFLGIPIYGVLLGGMLGGFITMLVGLISGKLVQGVAPSEEEFEFIAYGIGAGIIITCSYRIYHLIKTKKENKVKKILLKSELENLENLKSKKHSQENTAKAKYNTLLNSRKRELLNELDMDANNKLDLIETDDSFMALLKSQQKKILEFEKTEGKDFTNKFVKLSNFLKQKREHMQNLFSQFKQIKSLEVLDNAENLIKSDMYMYNLLLLDSLHMISSIVDDDRISFNIIYEKFDPLNVWNTNFQNQMLNKLDLLNDNIDRLRGDISEMNHNSNMIIDKLQDLSHISEENNRVLDKQLEKINSSIKANTVLNAINTYQNYSTNKRLS